VERSEQIRKALILEPLESTLFFRDGRPFQAKGQGTSGLPTPQTLAGALRTWFMKKTGCDFDKLAGDLKEKQLSLDAALVEQGGDIALVSEIVFRGPWLSLSDTPLFQAPSSLRSFKYSSKNSSGPDCLLLPLKEKLPGWLPIEEGMLPLWCRTGEPKEKVEGFLTVEGMQRFLRGAVPQESDFKCRDQLFGFDNRVGIGIDSGTMTTKEGDIYSISLLTLKKGVAFYAEVSGPGQLLEGLTDGVVLTFGGEKRHVRVRIVTPLDWDSLSNRTGEGKPMVVLLTPGLFSSSWKPDWMKPLAASVSKPVAISGWDLARGGPKPTRFAAPAGSVYYLSESLNRETDSLCEDGDAALGWGLYLEGRWNYA